MNELNGKVAIITGASRGIGAAVAHRLHAEGVHLGLASRSGDDLGLTDVVAQPCDVTDNHQVEALVAATVERFGGVDILIASAGIGVYKPFLDTPVDEMDEVVDINIKGTLYVVRAALPHILARGGGDVITVASESGRTGFADETIYCASKFAQVGFIRSLDAEFHSRNVRCANVAPGSVATDFAMGRGRTPGMPELEDMMSAEDVADVVMFVVSRPRNHRIVDTFFWPMNE
jgi:NADP-dependent 3-hydroxy acid dehydrogenase YdfG